VSRRYIAIEVDGIRHCHAASDGNYATLCGLDGDDPPEQVTVPLMIGERINCPQCRDLIFAAKQFRPKDFEKPDGR
jgi:hypothetical protein